MKSFFSLALGLTLTICATAFAQEGDLVLPGAKWYGQFEGYVCDNNGALVAEPAELSSIEVEFDKMYSDSTLDNILLTANFTEAGVLCRYNAIIFADNAAQTAVVTQSKAYAEANDGTCEEGKKLLDEKLASVDYLYYGKPHRAALLMKVSDAAALCGEGAEFVASAFVVKGKIQQ